MWQPSPARRSDRKFAREKLAIALNERRRAELAWRRCPMAACNCELNSPPRNRDLQRELVDHLMPLRGHDEGMAEEYPKIAVRRNWIGLRHDDHAGLEH